MLLPLATAAIAAWRSNKFLGGVFRVGWEIPGVNGIDIARIVATRITSIPYEERPIGGFG